MPKLLRILLIATLVFVSLKTRAQNEVESRFSILDSLLAVLPDLKGTDQIDCFNKISQAYYALNTDSAFLYAEKAYALSAEKNYWIGLSDALNNQGNIARERSNFVNSEEYFRRALEVSAKHDTTAQWCRDNLSLGYIFFLQGNFEEATALVNKSLDYYLRTHNEPMQDYTFRVLASIYSDQGYYENAFTYLQKGFGIGKNISDPKNSLSSTFMWNTYLLGKLYQDAGDYTTAIDYYNLSMRRAFKNMALDKYFSILGDVSVIRSKFDSANFYYLKQIFYLKQRIPDPVIFNSFLSEPSIKIGENYLAMNNYDTALSYLTKPLPLLVKSNSNDFLLRTYRDIAKAYYGKKNWRSSFQYAKLLLERAQATGTRQYIRDGYELYWKIFDAQGRADSAYRYYLQYTSIRDSIAKDVQLRNIAVGQMNMWREKQESRIALLQKEKKIQQQRSQLILYSLIGVIIIVLIISWNIILKRRNAMNRNRHLEDLVKLQGLEGENIKMEFEHRTAELEMQALRAQMNPHFIFNSLNAINRFILENDRQQASAYLTKFSRLVRMILHHSQENLISLENELESLRLYLELEALRFDNHFVYQIIVDPSLDVETLQVAPLIIQPYAENAIWHGLMHKEEKGSLIIDLYSIDEMLYCRITDDGIGRNKAAALKSKSVSVHKSMGMRITSDRISRMIEQSEADNCIKITDLVMADGTPGGTEIILKIPIIYA